MNHFRGDSTLIQELIHHFHHKTNFKVCQNRTFLTNPVEDIKGKHSNSLNEYVMRSSSYKPTDQCTNQKRKNSQTVIWM